MAIQASQLVGLVSIVGVEQSIAKMEAMGAATDAAGLKFAALAGGGALIAGAALIALAVKTNQMAADFQQGVNRLKTGGGDVQDSFNTLGNSIKQVAINSGIATAPLIQAMYQIVSANQRGTQAYQTLAAAAQGAQIEQANVVDVTKILTTLQTNWGLSTFTAAQYMSGLVKAVSEGKLTLEQLSTAMSPILPIAKQMGISFKDVAAAMSVQTNAGLDANRAATGLQAVFVNIENPTKKAASAMLQYGVNSVAAANEMKTSLPGAFQMLMDAALKVGPIGSVAFNRAMADMVGGGTRTAKTIDALSQHMKDWTADVGNIGNAMKSGSKDVSGWALAQSGFNIQMDRARASLEVLGISIGQALIPIMTKLVSAITPIIVAVTTWLVKNNAILPILGGLAALIAGVLVASLVTLAIAFWAVIWPVLAVGAAVALVVAGIILAIQHWGQITQWLGDVWKTISTHIGEAFSWLGTKVHDFEGVFKALGIVAAVALAPIVVPIAAIVLAITHFGQITTWIGNLVGTVFSAIGSWFTWLYNHNYYIKALVDFIVAQFTALKTFIGAVFSAIGTFIHDRLVWIQDVVSAVWGWISSFIGARANDAKNFVGNAFSALGTAMQNALTAAWNWVKGFVGGWPAEAFQWGANLIGGLINGIKSMVGNLFSSIGSIAHNITQFLGFHSPPQEGPMRDADTWMPNMMAMFVQGIASSSPNLRRALSSALVPVGTSLSVGTSGFSSGSLLPGGVSMAPAMLGGGHGPIVVNVNVNPEVSLDGVRLSRGLMPHIANALRYNVGKWG